MKNNISKQLAIVVVLLLISSVSSMHCACDSSVPSKYKFYKISYSEDLFPIYNEDYIENVSAPKFNPIAGTYDSDIAITITSYTDDCNIYYTLNGSEPNQSSFLYTAPVQITGNGSAATIRAIAMKNGMRNSDIKNSSYIINWNKCSTPQFTPSPGSYPNSLIAAIASTTDSTIKYTTDGTDPRTSITAITGTTLNISSYKSIKAYAYKDGMLNSDVVTVAYHIYQDMGVISSEDSFFTSAAIGSDDKPVIFFHDWEDTTKAEVKKWDAGTTWTSLGLIDADWSTDGKIALDSENIPYIIYNDNTNGRAHIMKWDSGTTWVDLGYASEGSADPVSIVIGPDDVPVIAYIDRLYGSKARVMKYDVGAWADYGFISGGQADNVSVVVDSGNSPIAAFRDNVNSYKIHVMKWDSGTIWIDLGYASTGPGMYPSLAIGSDDRPVVAYEDEECGDRYHVKKWSTGTTWIDLGFTTSDNASELSIAIGPDGIPVTAARDYYDPHIMKWKSLNTWTDHGYAGDNGGNTISLVVGSDGNPIVFFETNSYPDTIVAKKCIIY